MSDALQRFRQSMIIGFDQWHDGIGYDLEALAAMDEAERDSVRLEIRARLLNAASGVEWRDMEAAAALGETDTLERLLRHEDAEVRLRASRYLGAPAGAEDILCEALLGPDSAAASKALDDVCEHPTEKVRQAVITLLRRVDDNFIYAAFVALQVFGGVEDAWDERPFLFQVQEQGPGGPLLDQLIARLTPDS